MPAFIKLQEATWRFRPCLVLVHDVRLPLLIPAVIQLALFDEVRDVDVFQGNRAPVHQELSMGSFTRSWRAGDDNDGSRPKGWLRVIVRAPVAHLTGVPKCERLSLSSWA